MLRTGIVVSFLSKELPKLHVSSTLSFSVFKFIWKLKVAFYEHLKFLLIHLGIYIFASNFAQVTNCHTLTSNTTHLDGISKSELMIDWSFFVVTDVIVDDTKINMSQELASNIGYFFVLSVILNGIFVVLRLRLPNLHVVNPDTIVR